MTAAAEQHPAFVTAEECRAWLAGTPLGNPVQAQAHLLRQLNLLNRHGVDADERLSILELLRKPLMRVQEEGARRFVGKPLPLAPPELAAFEAAQAVWQGLLAGYARCIESALAGDMRLKAQLGLVIQRAIGALAAAQFDIYRAGFQPAPDHWRTLHELYATAEQAGVTERVVEDGPRQGRMPSSPRALYVETLLLHAASPHELPLRHLLWVARWARRWSAKIGIAPQPPAPEGESIALCIDLAASDPAGYQPAAGPAARWLDTEALRHSLKKRLTLLERGTPPAELQLGEDCVQPACGQVLKLVYQRWCRGGTVRRHERQADEGRCELVLGIDALHYYLSGRKPFRQPSRVNDDALRREREELATFGRVAGTRPAGFSQQQGYRIEEWLLVDESPAGLQVTRPLNQGGGRVAPGQLIAIRLPGAQSLVLGCLRWAMVTADARLHAGLLMFPGRPEPVAARVLDPAGSKEPYRPAFLLPAIEALHLPATVVIPSGQFRSERTLEVAGTCTRRVRLAQLVDHGADFDRATYEPAD